MENEIQDARLRELIAEDERLYGPVRSRLAEGKVFQMVFDFAGDYQSKDPDLPKLKGEIAASYQKAEPLIASGECPTGKCSLRHKLESDLDYQSLMQVIHNHSDPVAVMADVIRNIDELGDERLINLKKNNPRILDMALYMAAEVQNRRANEAYNRRRGVWKAQEYGESCLGLV